MQFPNICFARTQNTAFEKKIRTKGNISVSNLAKANGGAEGSEVGDGVWRREGCHSRKRARALLVVLEGSRQTLGASLNGINKGRCGGLRLAKSNGQQRGSSKQAHLLR